MNSMNTSLALDFKTTTAILNANPEGVAIIGAWNTMETLAREDPEGCVRLSPGLPMDNTALAAFFHCTVSVVEKTIEVFEKLKRITVKDGMIKVLGYGEDRNGSVSGAALNVNNMARKTITAKAPLTEESLAKKREQNRLRKAKSRARQKQEQEQVTVTEGNVTPVTSVTTCDQRDNMRDRECDNERDMCDSNAQNRMAAAVPQSVTGRDKGCDLGDCQCDTEYTATALNNRNINYIYPLHAPYAHKHVSKFENIILLNQLTEDYRNVLDAWNSLPLTKYKGLIPELLEKLKYLMKRYGKGTLCKTISGIAHNPFLLGKKEGKTWKVSLGWLLEPANFAKVLSGKFEDRKYENDNGETWHPGERLPFYLPGEGPEGYTPEEQRQVLHNLFTPTTPAQLKAARLVGLPGYREVSA